MFSSFGETVHRKGCGKGVESWEEGESNLESWLRGLPGRGVVSMDFNDQLFPALSSWGDSHPGPDARSAGNVLSWPSTPSFDNFDFFNDLEDAEDGSCSKDRFDVLPPPAECPSQYDDFLRGAIDTTAPGWAELEIQGKRMLEEAVESRGSSKRHRSTIESSCVHNRVESEHVPASPKLVDTPQVLMTTPESFPCKLCNRSFRKKSSLSNHMQTHETERPYKCHLCLKSFKFQATRNRHMLHKHPAYPAHIVQ